MYTYIFDRIVSFIYSMCHHCFYLYIMPPLLFCGFKTYTLGIDHWIDVNALLVSFLCLNLLCRFLLPATLIVINDIAAYFFGFFFGRTPLIKLSPKKTWEGFIGASVTTIFSAFLVSKISICCWRCSHRRGLGGGLGPLSLNQNH